MYFLNLLTNLLQTIALQIKFIKANQVYKINYGIAEIYHKILSCIRKCHSVKYIDTRQGISVEINPIFVML